MDNKREKHSIIHAGTQYMLLMKLKYTKSTVNASTRQSLTSHNTVLTQTQNNANTM